MIRARHLIPGNIVLIIPLMLIGPCQSFTLELPPSYKFGSYNTKRTPLRYNPIISIGIIQYLPFALELQPIIIQIALVRFFNLQYCCFDVHYSFEIVLLKFITFFVIVFLVVIILVYIGNHRLVDEDIRIWIYDKNNNIGSKCDINV